MMGLDWYGLEELVDGGGWWDWVNDFWMMVDDGIGWTTMITCCNIGIGLGEWFLDDGGWWDWMMGLDDGKNNNNKD